MKASFGIRITLFIFSMAFLLNGTVRAQNALKEKMEEIKASTGSDSIKVYALAELAIKAAKKSMDDGLSVITEMEMISKESPSLTAFTKVNKGEVYLKNSSPEKALENFQLAFRYYDKSNNQKMIVGLLVRQAKAYQQLNNHDKVIEKYSEAYRLAEQKAGIEVFIEVVNDYYGYLGKRGDRAAQFKLLSDQLEFVRQSSSRTDDLMAECYMDLAYYYFYLEKFQESYQYCELARPHAERSANDFRKLDVYNTGGSALKALKRQKDALVLLHKAGDLLEATTSPIKRHLGSVYTNLGITYYELGEPAKGFEYKVKALEFFRKTDNESGVFNVNIAIGIDLIEIEKKPELAVKYLHEAELKFKEHGSLYTGQHLYRSLHQSYATMGNYEKAYQYFEKFLTIRDSSLNSEKQKQLGEMEAKYENSKKEQQIEMLSRDQKIGQLMLLRNKEALEKEKAENQIKENSILLLEQESNLKEEQLAREKAQTEAERNKAMLAQEQKKLAEKEALDQRRINMMFGGASLLLIIFLISLYRGYRQKKKANEEIIKQKSIIELQKAIVEEKNKEVLDSINYAKRLQDAILPPIAYLTSLLRDSFILYKPKDIVAGDFYWLEEVSNSRNEKLIYFAVADCTGHGVPGAMVSVVCSNALHRTVKEFGMTDPGAILDKVTELVLETFSRSESDVKDGMDISLAVFNTNTKELFWSGANNPLWILRDGNITEIKPDKQPIGSFDGRKPFTTHAIRPLAGDVFYLFSDGYCDQFGGEKGKKLKEANFRKMLLAMNGASMLTQQQQLLTAFENWRGDLEQVDDVCVLGVRLF